MIDESGNEINLGDILESEDGYCVTVVEWPGIDEWVGKLICEPGHSCENIPYSLNGGRGYTRRGLTPVAADAKSGAADAR